MKPSPYKTNPKRASGFCRLFLLQTAASMQFPSRLIGIETKQKRKLLVVLLLTKLLFLACSRVVNRERECLGKRLSQRQSVPVSSIAVFRTQPAEHRSVHRPLRRATQAVGSSF